ncbi:MAG: LysM peptidoglycan-binding domain-containing protein, partial [Acidobacteriota bacterium]|nr:LysM peptidoglycan-binding domain-containing protein [Acidobacteriota bacterium]
MKNYKHTLTIFFTIIFILFSLNCSSYRRPVIEDIKASPPPDPKEEINLVTIEEEPIPNYEENNDTVVSKQALQEEPEEEQKKDPSELLEEAMNAYQDAKIAWDQGDMDTALTALDEAYRLIIDIELPHDSPLIQEKTDLRLLIARRIQEIYASQATVIGENHQTIPLVENKYVLKEIKSFQTKEKKYFESSYKRSGRYREIILKELEKEGLPQELSWMPIIESGFKIRAYSRARALGLWQFISSTGYRYGLKRDRWIDERMDPEKATRAAIKYLKELHSFFGDWTTALASYNCGEFRVRRVIQAQRINYLDNFWDLYPMLPTETARFVPRFIATLLIINNPEKYGMNLPVSDSPLRYKTITVKRAVKLSSLSKKLGLREDELADLNPELRYKSTPDQKYQLKVPISSEESALAALNSLPRWIPPETTYEIHYVRRGETVSGIAKRYRTSVSAIARLNRLGRRYLIRPGQRLKVPSKGVKVYRSSQSRSLTKEGNKLIYKVKRGDSLYLIANAFKTTIQKIKTLNG